MSQVHAPSENKAKPGSNEGPQPIRGLHHWAYKCRDAEETRHFYEDVLGLPLVHIIRADDVPSTGQHCPYVHLFFEMTDGSCVAFFDLGDDIAPDPSPNTPAWVNHMALRVDSLEALAKMKAHLEANGIPVRGEIDHHFVKSIYFFDPNGYMLEITVQTRPFLKEDFSDASMTLEAAMHLEAEGERGGAGLQSIDDVWRAKAELIETAARGL